MPRATALAAAALAILVTGCTDGKFAGGPVFEYGRDLVGLGTGTAAPPAEPLPSVGPPLIVGYNDIRVALPNTSTTGQTRTFTAPDGVTIVMTNGHVTRVTGLGVDLEGMFLPADSPYTGNLVEAAKRGESADRIADYYQKGKILNDSFRCTLSYTPAAGTKGIITEQCRRFYGGNGFTNTYWTEADKVVCSKQWFNPKAQQLQFFQTQQQAKNTNLNQQGC